MNRIADGTKIGKYTVLRCTDDRPSLGAFYEVREEGDTEIAEVNLLSEGTILDGRYKIVRFLGGGGFGQAYLGDYDGTAVVLKRFLYAGDDSDYKRLALRREGQTLAALHHHDHLPKVDAYFAVDAENAFLVMSLVPGVPLDDWVAARRRDPNWNQTDDHAKRVLGWCLTLADILAHLHNLSPNPLIHLDIKPPNVMIGDDDKLSLIDFGAARLVRPRTKADFDPQKTVIGISFGYTAPEYEYPTNGIPTPTPQCDIYSVGMLMRVMLTGNDPADVRGPADRKKAPPVPPLDPIGQPIWDGLAAISEKARNLLPEKRYQTAEEFRDALLFASDDPARGPADIVCRHCRKRARRGHTYCQHCGEFPRADAVQPAEQSKADPVPIAHGAADEQHLGEILTLVGRNEPAEMARFRLYQQLQMAEQDPGFSELFCLDQIKADRLPHQTEAAQKILREMAGFCLLADEVGLGKTITAGIVLKELIVRELAQRILIVAPAQVCTQWQEELYQRFGEYFLQFGRDVETTLGWRCDRLIVPYPVAEDRTHRLAALAHDYDLVILDEAHHLIERDTQRSWKLREFARLLGQKATRLLMLSGTPMLKELRELHTLLTLLKPGSVGSLKDFKDRYINLKKPGEIRNAEELQTKVRSVMIRNTRECVPELKFMTREVYARPVTVPERYRTRFQRFRKFIGPLCRHPDDIDDDEGYAFYDATVDLLEAYHSSPAAFASRCDDLVRNYRQQMSKPNWRAAEATLQDFRHDHHEAFVGAKVEAVCEILNRRQKYGGKFLIFTQYHETARLLRDAVMAGTGMEVERYPAPDEDESGERGHVVLQAFHGPVNVLVCGPNANEGLNLQIAHSLINYDLPSDAMKIEQRIGRIQRYGQKEPKVLVWNLFLEGTAEEDILRKLDEQFQLFRKTIGEVEPVLGSICRRAQAEGLSPRAMLMDQIVAGDFDADERTEVEERTRRVLTVGQQEQTTGDALMEKLVPRSDHVASPLANREELPADTAANLKKLGRAVGKAPAALTDPSASSTYDQPLTGAAADDDDESETAPVAAIGTSADPLEEEVAPAATAIRCPHCGETQVDAGTFCGDCGQPLAAVPVVVPVMVNADAFRCPYCHEVQVDVGNCCGDCGKELPR